MRNRYARTALPGCNTCSCRSGARALATDQFAFVFSCNMSTVCLVFLDFFLTFIGLSHVAISVDRRWHLTPAPHKHICVRRMMKTTALCKPIPCNACYVDQTTSNAASVSCAGAEPDTVHSTRYTPSTLRPIECALHTQPSPLPRSFEERDIACLFGRAQNSSTHYDTHHIDTYVHLPNTLLSRHINWLVCSDGHRFCDRCLLAYFASWVSPQQQTRCLCSAM